MVTGGETHVQSTELLLECVCLGIPNGLGYPMMLIERVRDIEVPVGYLTSQEKGSVTPNDISDYLGSRRERRWVAHTG
jgi:hypothetical protein